MKTLLNEKLTIVFASALLCVTILRAQVPDRIKNLPYFRTHPSMLSSIYKTHVTQKLNTPSCTPNAYCLKVQTVLGGSGDDNGQMIIPTSDGGFAVCGATLSNNGDFHTGDTINGDAFVAKYNKFRKLEWAKTYGGSGFEAFNNIIQSPDGSYIIAGQTTSNDGDVSGNHGGSDVWIVKLSPSGKLIWQKCYGGTGDELAQSLVKNFYGGYAIVGRTTSNDDDVSGNHNTDGNWDGWFIQIGETGKLLFQHCYGGSDYDEFQGIVPSGYGNFIIAGSTFSVDGDIKGNHGILDVWVIKLNALGKILWERTIGGSGYDYVFPNAITNVIDGNVVIDGNTNSVDGDVNNLGDSVGGTLMIKLNSNTGKDIWIKNYTEPSQRAAFGVFATKDGGTAETGTGGGNDVDGYNVLVSKFDKYGNQEWYKQLGGSDFDLAIAGYEARNGDLNIVAQTASIDGDIKQSDGGLDTWLLKLAPCGGYATEDNLQPDKIMSESEDKATNLLVYPNPVSNSTTISFSIPQSQKVSLAVYDINGKFVKTIMNAQMRSGSYQFSWDGKDEKGNNVGSGIYFLSLQTGIYLKTKKISVIR